jgi:hypothetical protein
MQDVSRHLWEHPRERLKRRWGKRFTSVSYLGGSAFKYGLGDGIF